MVGIASSAQVACLYQEVIYWVLVLLAAEMEVLHIHSKLRYPDETGDYRMRSFDVENYLRKEVNTREVACVQVFS